MSKEELEKERKIRIPIRSDFLKKSKKAVKWFTDRIKEKIRGKDSHPADKKLTVGHMYLYRYDAKTKNKLPYWDAVPLCIPIGYYKGGFLGLNLHYIPPTLRAKLLQELDKYLGTQKGEKRFLRVAYGRLRAISKLRAFRPCLKRYLYSHLKSRPQRIPPSEWENAVLLPTAKWMKASSSAVYRDSMKAIRGNLK